MELTGSRSCIVAREDAINGVECLPNLSLLQGCMAF